MNFKNLNDFFGDVQEVYDAADVFVNTEFADSMHREAAKALACCVNAMGYVHLPWMSDNSGLSVQELIEALEGAIYQDPAGYDLHQSDEEDWMLRAQYLNGNIADRLDTAKRMNRKYNGRFDGNVLVLKEAMPEKVPFDEIGICIGSSWVPPVYYALFAKELLGVKEAPEVLHSAALGQWKVRAADSVKKSFCNQYAYGCTYKNQGITKCISMLQILEHTLNGSTIKIYEEVSRPERKSGAARVLLKNETIAAQEKQVLLQKAFSEWVVKDPVRVKHLENVFYDALACNVASRYDGSFLTLPDLNSEFVPYRHQKDAVSRIILEKDVLLNHSVGSGKTNILIMGIHERYRMGLSEKNLVVVPNNVLEAFERAHRFLYPEDRILVIRPEAFKPECREEIMKKVRDEPHAAVYMAFSSFDMVKMSRQYRLDRKAEEIRDMRAKEAAAQDKWEKRICETIIKKLNGELSKMQEELPEDKFLPFDQLGITTLAVDEVHNYKNVSLKTSADGVVGMHKAGSRKSDEMMDKAQYVRSHDGSIIFSTGTPLTNSISDLFVLQMFLQPEQMSLLNLGHFDEWVGTFASRRAGFEVDVDSQNFRIMTRFSSFHNLPELTSLFASVSDYYDGRDSGVGLPECDGYIDTVVPKSPEQAEYIEELVLRTEMIRAKLVRGDEDNLLKVTHDGRAAALDIRLAETGRQPDSTTTKTFACAKNVYDCYQSHPGTAQLVFCDQGTPKKGFNIYDELKDHLIQMGIPETQVAFVHDAKTDVQRRRLFEAVNKAEIRVLIGSTSKLGTGVNVQERLVAVHHLDVPWKPADLSQRDGRLIRQGNGNAKVYRYRYITAGTFDAYSWQIVENKQRFIGRFMSGSLADRETRDIDDAVLTYAEIKALSVGDPLLRTRIETSNELERVKIHSCRRDMELRRMKNFLEEGPLRMDRAGERKRRLAQDRKHFEKKRESLTRQTRLEFGEELLYALKHNIGRTEERFFDTLHGFRILLPADMNAEKPYVLISGNSGNRYEADMREAKEAGCIQRVEHLLLHLDDRIRAAEEEIARLKTEASQAKEELAKGNTYAAEADRLNQKLLDIDQELNRRAEEKTA
ncbi:MAG: helicase-related protein [Eubacteriales bacterium]|nr:helicase-related protein [Eubacteriales bacterium]